MDLDKTKTPIDTEPQTPELESAIDAFLTGVESDDFDKMLERVQSLEGLSPGEEKPPEKKRRARAPRSSVASAVARWMPNFKAKEKKKAPPVPDPRRLPPAERQLAREPGFGPAPEERLAEASPLDPRFEYEAPVEGAPVEMPIPEVTPEGLGGMSADGLERSPVVEAEAFDAEAFDAGAFDGEAFEAGAFEDEPVEVVQAMALERVRELLVELAPEAMGVEAPLDPDDAVFEEGELLEDCYDYGDEDAAPQEAVGSWEELWSFEQHPEGDQAEGLPSAPMPAAEVLSLLDAHGPLETLTDVPEPEAFAALEAEPAPEPLDDEERRLRELIEAPVETAPVDTAPVDTAPVDTAPVETARAFSDDLDLGELCDTTLSVPLDVMASALAAAEQPSYDAPAPPPTVDMGATADVDPFHASTDGLHPSTEWRTFTPRPAAPVVMAPPEPPAAPAVADAPAPSMASPLPEPSLAAALADAQARVRQGFPLPTSFGLHARVSAVARVCELVASAHARGEVHGDLRPAVVGYGPYGDVSLAGWHGSAPLGETVGLADAEACFYEVSEDPGRLTLVTAHGPVTGSPCYLAPERLSGEAREATPASDVYALGLMLFEATTLSPAFSGGNLSQVLDAALDGRRARRPIAGGRPVPRGLQAIIDKATAIAAGGRHGDAGDLLADLRIFLGQAPRRSAPAWAWASGGALTATAAAAVLTAGLGMGFMDDMKGEVDGIVAEAAALRHQDAVRADVARHAHEVDRALDRYQDLAGALAAATEEVQRHAPQSGDAIFRLYEFRTEGRQPADLAEAAAYKGAISLEEPMFKLSPRGAFAELRAQSRRVAFATDRLRAAFFAAATHGIPGAAVEDAALRAGGSPVHRAFLAFDSGLDVLYPGQAGYPDDWEGRLQPWYGPTLSARGPVWSPVFDEVHGAGPVMAVAAPMVGADGSPVGVAGFEIATDRLAAAVLPMVSEAGFESSWLVDPAGARVVLGTPRSGAAGGPLPIYGVSRAIASQAYGLAEVEGGQLAAWAPVDATGWTYVALFTPPAAKGGEEMKVAAR